MNAIVAILGGWRAAALGVLAVALLVACLFLGWRASHMGARADAAESKVAALEGDLDAAQEVIALERRRAESLAVIAEQYEQDKADAQRTADRVVADLRAGNERLRDHWQGCIATGELSAAASAARESDAAEQLRNEGAANLVRLAAEADAHVRGLQEVIRKDRER